MQLNEPLSPTLSPSNGERELSLSSVLPLPGVSRIDPSGLSETVETAVDRLLKDQAALTAVERFSRLHDISARPSPAARYRHLLPATAPGPGSQYAFEVDLDRCSGCKSCVTACHSLNGLEEHETWRSVGLLVSAPKADACRSTSPPPVLYQQHVTTACHHCVDPACLNGCPVLAYDKDPLTGIVRHLDDQCIGCSYCIMKCPYEVPRFSRRLGIVRKCDLCHARLAVNEPPACAQACPHEAIRIAVVATADIVEAYRGADVVTVPNATDRRRTFLPDSPDPALTLPTTRYVGGPRSTQCVAPSLSPNPDPDLDPSPNPTPKSYSHSRSADNLSAGTPKGDLQPRSAVNLVSPGALLTLSPLARPKLLRRGEGLSNGEREELSSDGICSLNSDSAITLRKDSLAPSDGERDRERGAFSLDNHSSDAADLQPIPDRGGVGVLEGLGAAARARSGARERAGAGARHGACTWDAMAADHDRLRLDPPHWPLVFMLLLTQAAVGLFLAGWIGSTTRWFAPGPLFIAGFACLVVGLQAAVFHLGQPLKAWRAFLGWRRSWLSREIIAFHVLAGAAALVLAQPFVPGLVAAKPWLEAGVALAGLGAVFTSAMVYIDTGRPLWAPRLVLGNFFGTTLLLGTTFAAVLLGWSAGALDAGLLRATQAFAIVALFARTALFAWRRMEMRSALSDVANPIHLNARAIRELLPWTRPTRTVLFVVSTILGVFAIGNLAGAGVHWASLSALATFSSEIIARYVFFVAGTGRRMPGGIHA